MREGHVDCGCMDLPYQWACFTHSLFSKFGNNDGDAPCWWYEEFNEKPPFDWHDFLWAAIHKWVVPVLDAKVEVQFVETCHNPVRIWKVGGQDCTDDWFKAQKDVGWFLTPPVVVVQPPEVKALIEEMVAKGPCPICRHVGWHCDLDCPGKGPTSPPTP